MKRVLFCVLLGLVGAGPGLAQRAPRLPAGADTNDAAAYVRLGRDKLIGRRRKDIAVAESALVWAARLDPASGEPPYLLAIAMLRANGREWWSKRARRSRVQTQRLDSLMWQAWLREPFYDIELEPLLVFGDVPPSYLGRNAIERAYLAYQHADHPLALASWAEALVRAPDRIDLRFHRAHTFYWLGEYDSTIVELRAALAVVTQPDSGEWSVLPPTDILYYALGVAHERAGHPDSASEAYREALVANLGIHMAHARLSNILLNQGDTARAFDEVSVALDVAPPEPLLTAYYGSVLLRAGRPSEAVVQLQAALNLDSSYAAPYFLLGAAYTALQRDREALSNFENFLMHAARNDERRAWATQRIAELRTALSDARGPRE